jgi:hypothetical protein
MAKEGAVSLIKVLRAIALGAILVGVLLVQAVPVEAAGGPTVIAVHRNGAFDMSGQVTFGSVARMSVPAGNWLITATSTIQTTTSVSDVECQLVAGTEFYKSISIPTGGGVGSSQPMVLLLAHHFAKKGAVILKCKSNGWLGDVLVRDVHMTAVQVGQLTDTAGIFGTGAPAASYAQDSSARGWTDSSNHDVQDLRLPAGTWLVQAVAWGGAGGDGDRIDCTLGWSSTTVDQFVGDFEGVQRAVYLEGVITLPSPGGVNVTCHDGQALWYLYGSAISAIQVGTLKYGPLGGSLTTTGSGSPTVIGGYNDSAGGVAASQALSSIASESLGTGSWFVTAKSSFLGAAPANITCQARLGTVSDQGRVIIDAGNNMANWMAMSLTKAVSATSNASLACGQSASSGDVAYFHVRLFALKAGSLTDTDLD